MNATTFASIHTPGARVSGTYMGLPISGTVIDSHSHFYNSDRWEIRITVDEGVNQLLEDAELCARGVVIVTVAFSGAALGGFDTDTLEVTA